MATSAAMRFSGMPHSPKPPTHSVAPSGMSAMASAGDAKILLLDFTMPFLAGGCVEIRLAARERLHDQPFIIRPCCGIVLTVIKYVYA